MKSPFGGSTAVTQDPVVPFGVVGVQSRPVKGKLSLQLLTHPTTCPYELMLTASPMPPPRPIIVPMVPLGPVGVHRNDPLSWSPPTTCPYELIPNANTERLASSGCERPVTAYRFAACATDTVQRTAITRTEVNARRFIR